MKNRVWAISLILLIAACSKEEPLTSGSGDSPYDLVLPAGFPEMPIPEDNALTVKRVELGKALFFDKRLSRDGSISCGSCHFQELAFSDGQQLSTGIEGRQGFRNSVGLFNLGWHERLMKDGGVPSLELQVLVPVHDENEMDFEMPLVVEILSDDEHLQRLARTAYDRPLDAYVITRAIAAFERTLVSGNSPYDRYIQGDPSALNPEELRGMELFFSNELQCGSCHSGHLLADNEFHNIGLYEEYADEGRFRITNDESDKGKFKTPSLRNIALTAPYMHNGSLATLEAVIDHFSEGGVGHPNQDVRIQALNLTQEQKADLISFMLALTDQEFISNPAFKP